jgi:hypothetical protein
MEGSLMTSIPSKSKKKKKKKKNVFTMTGCVGRLGGK